MNRRVKSAVFPEIVEKSPKEIFYNELSPLFPLSRIMGLFVYNSKFEVPRLYVVLSLLFYLFINGPFMYKGSSIFWTDFMRGFTPWYKIMFVVTHVINWMLINTHLIVIIFNRNLFQEYINIILYLNYNWNEHSALYSKHAIKVGLVVMVSSYLYIAAQFFVSREGFLVTGMYLVSEFMYFLIVMQFCSIVDIIKVHMKELREELKGDEYEMISIVKKHQTLVGYCEIVNEAYSVQMLIVCLRYFFFAVVVVYLIIINYLLVFPNILRSVYLLIETSIIILVTKACSQTSEEADSFNKKLFNIMRESKDLCSSDKLRLYVTMKQTVNFTAYGFFSLGYPLLTSIIAAGTTYLVIMVQFSMPNN